MDAGQIRAGLRVVAVGNSLRGASPSGGLIFRGLRPGEELVLTGEWVLIRVAEYLREDEAWLGREYPEYEAVAFYRSPGHNCNFGAERRPGCQGILVSDLEVPGGDTSSDWLFGQLLGEGGRA